MPVSRRDSEMGVAWRIGAVLQVEEEKGKRKTQPEPRRGRGLELGFYSLSAREVEPPASGGKTGREL